MMHRLRRWFRPHDDRSAAHPDQLAQRFRAARSEALMQTRASRRVQRQLRATNPIERTILGQGQRRPQ